MNPLPTMLLGFILLGQTSAKAPPRPSSADAAPPKLGEVYVDGSEGFAIRPPAAWQVDRRCVVDARGVTVLRLIGPPIAGQSQEIKIRRVATAKRMSAEELLKHTVDMLGLEFNGAHVETQQVQQIAGSAGGFVSAYYGREGYPWFCMRAVVETSPRLCFVLAYDGPDATARQSEPLFQLVVSSLAMRTRILNEDELKKSLDTGTAWMGSLSEADLKRAVAPKQILRIEIEGGSEGFMVIEQCEFSLDRRPGVRVAERGWTFERDGRARSFENIMFIGNDQQDEKWQSKSTTLVPALEGKHQQMDVAEEEGLRSKDLLLSAQAYGLHVPKLDNPALRLPRTYVSRALLRMLPRLVKDLDKPRSMAFTTFDHLRGDLVVQLMDLKGASPAPEGARAGKAFRIDQYDGLASEPSQLYVDASGEVLLIKAGAMTMKPMDEKELDRTMGARVVEADRKISELEKLYSQEQQRIQRDK